MGFVEFIWDQYAFITEPSTVEKSHDISRNWNYTQPCILRSSGILYVTSYKKGLVADEIMFDI